MDTVEKTYDGFVSQQGGTVHVADAETRLALTKRAVLGSIQAQSRSLSYCTPQSAKSTLTPSQLNTSHSGGSSSSKREKFIQVSVEANPPHDWWTWLCEQFQRSFRSSKESMIFKLNDPKNSPSLFVLSLSTFVLHFFSVHSHTFDWPARWMSWSDMSREHAKNKLVSYWGTVWETDILREIHTLIADWWLGHF